MIKIEIEKKKKKKTFLFKWCIKTHEHLNFQGHNSQ